jgi:membrane-associated phospholipid phosphatase
MKLISLITVFCLPTFIYAQTVDTVAKDSLVKINNQSTIHKGQNPPNVRSFIVPAVFITYGMVSLGNNAIRTLDYSTRNEIQEDHPRFANRLDDYLRFVPGVAFYGLNLAGIKSKHSIADGTGLYVLSLGIMSVSTIAVKRAADRLRPDGSDNYSFPSGHSASAFAAAEFLNQEYRDVSPWIGYAGYTVATATAAFRLYNNKHWLSDVVAGAGFGIASTKVAYLIYPSLKRLVIGKQTVKYSLVPMYQQKAVGFAFSGSF